MLRCGIAVFLRRGNTKAKTSAFKSRRGAIRASDFVAKNARREGDDGKKTV
jgi:hypothetical protein